jgi:hypothetical protein
MVRNRTLWYLVLKTPRSRYGTLDLGNVSIHTRNILVELMLYNYLLMQDGLPLVLKMVQSEYGT